MSRHSVASRAAVACAALLAACHLVGAALATDDGGERGIGLLLSSALLAASIGMARGNRFEARLAAFIVCVLDLGAVVLVLTIGPPGEGREPFDVSHAAFGTLATTVVVLLLLDARARRHRPEAEPWPPYAR